MGGRNASKGSQSLSEMNKGIERGWRECSFTYSVLKNIKMKHYKKQKSQEVAANNLCNLWRGLTGCTYCFFKAVIVKMFATVAYLYIQQMQSNITINFLSVRWMQVQNSVSF